MHCSATVAHLVTGSHLHGYGSLADGREFTVRASEGTVRLEVYRLDARQPVPDTADVELVTERTSRGVDLDDERSARALVQDMTLLAEPPARGVVRALGEALDEVVEEAREAITGISRPGIRPAGARDTPARHR